MKKILIFIITFVILAILLSLRFISIFKIPVAKPIDINAIKIVDLKSDNNKNPALSLKVLSANLVAEVDQQTQSPPETDSTSSASASLSPTKPPIITSLRILGEIENNGTEIVGNATPLITFFDSGGMQIATKVGSWSENYIFPKLKPQQKYFYDFTIKSLPENFVNISINFTPATSTTSATPISEILKIQNRDVEEKIASSSAKEQIYYYTITGQMINIGTQPVKNVRVVAYAKDNNGLVFSWASQEFPSDLFSPSQTQNISINLTPFKLARMEQLEIFLFGEEL
jgi:hypothetical protein